MVEALSEQTATGGTILSNIHEMANLTEEKTRFEQYQESSFWIFHIGPEICLTLLACILFVSRKVKGVVVEVGTFYAQKQGNFNLRGAQKRPF